MTKFRIGNLEVTRLEDIVDPSAAIKFGLPELDDETLAENQGWLSPSLLDGASDTMSDHTESRLFKARHYTILVETGGGNPKRPHFPAFQISEDFVLVNQKAAVVQGNRAKEGVTNG